jgi:hypothetical protein
MQSDRMPHQLSLAAAGYECWPAFLTPEQITAFCESLKPIPILRVTCGKKEISWDEQRLAAGTPLFDFFLSREVLEKVAERVEAAGNMQPELRCWTSIYQAGEYINPHKDGSGDVQLLVCLRATERANGGTLVLEHAGRRTELQLAPGDGVLFKATEVLHYTTPLLPLPSVPEPQRMVAVGRYYFQPRTK